MKNKNSLCWYKDVCSLDCKPNCLRYIEMKALMDSSDIPPNKQIPDKLVPESIDRQAFIQLNDIRLNIVDFVKAGKSLYLWSNHTGNGKTSWALKIMLRYFNDIWAGNGFRVRGKFVHVPTFLLQLKDFNNPLSDEYKNDILNCDLIIFDDIASVGISQYDLSQLLLYIDHRSLYGKSTIYTGNLNMYDMDKVLGSRLTSRIWSNNTTIIELKGADRR